MIGTPGNQQTWNKSIEETTGRNLTLKPYCRAARLSAWLSDFVTELADLEDEISQRGIV